MLFTSIGYGQDTIYLDENFKELKDIKLSDYFQIVEKLKDDPEISIEKIFYIDGLLKSERTYKNYGSKKKELLESDFFYKNGQLHIHSELKNGKYDGNFLSFWENGHKKRKDVYKKGKLLEGICWDINGNKVEYYAFEIPSQYPGGLENFIAYVRINLLPIVPPKYKGEKVIVKFEIDEQGMARNVVLSKSFDSQFDNKLKEIFQKMPNWDPAFQDGVAVSTTKSLPLAL